MSAVKITGPPGPRWRMWGSRESFLMLYRVAAGGKCFSLCSSAIKTTKAGTLRRTGVHLLTVSEPEAGWLHQFDFR